MQNTLDLKWWEMVLSLLGGASIFLYGMDLLSKGLQRAANQRIKHILGKLTNNRFIGMMVGVGVTSIIQSSTATTVMLVGLVQAGLISFSQTLAVILGADIGTTITIQLMALKLADYSLVLVIIGFSIKTFGKKDNKDLLSTAEAILGGGLLFYGMKIMSDSMMPLQGHPTIMAAMRTLENPFLGVMVSAAITALIHSSAASIGMVVILAQQSLVSLEGSIPLIMGANIGTCVTAIIASWNTSREAQRVSIAHVLFKVGGVLLFIAWIPTFAEIVRTISMHLGQGTDRQVANAHTVFNVVLALAFLPFTQFFGRLLIKLYPDKRIKEEFVIKTKHLDTAFLNSPAMAIDLARLEISNMANILESMLNPIMMSFISNRAEVKDETYSELTLEEGINFKEKKLDFLEEKITDYLLKIGSVDTSEKQANEVFALVSITKDFESIGDIIQKNILPLISKKRRLNVNFSLEGTEELSIYHLKVCKQISRLQKIFTVLDPKRLTNIIKKMNTYLVLESDYRRKHLERIRAQRKESIETHEIHIELMDYFKHINMYTGNIAKSMNECNPEIIIEEEKKLKEQEQIQEKEKSNVG